MANHKSAFKRQRQNLKRRLHNNHYRSTVRTIVTKAMTAAKTGSDDAEVLLKKAISTVDKVRGKGILPKNRGARYVSRLTKVMNGLKK